MSAKQNRWTSIEYFFLILYDIWEKLYGKEFADQAVVVEKKRKGLYDHESAWEWALAFTKEQRAAQFKELREFKEKGAARTLRTNPIYSAHELAAKYTYKPYGNRGLAARDAHHRRARH